MPSMCFFFFFQAEDGIRDLYVTGVQTCALPISPLPSGLRTWAAPRSSPRSKAMVRVRSEERREGKSVDLGGRRIIKKKKTKRNRKNQYKRVKKKIRINKKKKTNND